MLNRLIRLSYKSHRFAVLTGYEIHLSRLLKQGMRDVLPRFDSDRMADEYYRMMYDQ